MYRLARARTRARTWAVAALAIGLISGVSCSSSDRSSQDYAPPAPSRAVAQLAATQSSAEAFSFNNQVDILFVIDTKEGMSTIQQNLAVQMPEFVTSLNNAGVDYQIAVTTMDMSANGEKGKLLGSPSIGSAQTANLANMLQSRLYIGDYDWKPTTRAFEAVKSALSGINTTSGPNSGFLRPNALLTMIFLSNRDDRSAPDDSPDRYKGFFDQIRPPRPYRDRSWVAEFLGVLPDDPSCKTAAWGYAEPGLAFIDMANASGGAVESICSGDLTGAMINVRQRVLEKVTVYPLSQKPNVDTIKVTVNGQVVDKDAANGWTYDATTNTIRFHGLGVPVTNGSVHVDFQPSGLS